MHNYIALILLSILLGTTGYIFFKNVIQPVYKTYKEQMLIKSKKPLN